MMKNIQDLRDELIDAFNMVKEDKRCAGQVKEMVNAAGKILGTVKLELEYAAIRGDKPVIPFLGDINVIDVPTDVKELPKTVATG